MGEGQLNKISEKMIASLKGTTPASALRHTVRIATILAKASFWAVCYHYFGTRALLFVAASWMFLLGTKDLTFVRVRLASIKQPSKRKDGFVKSVAAELLLILLRLAAIGGLAAILVPFNRDVAAIVAMISVVAALWTRETFITTASAFKTGAWRPYASLMAAVGAIIAVIYFAENNFDPVHSAIWALLLREAITFFGFALVALLGCLGLQARPDNPDEDDDDEDGGEAAPVVGTDGREIRSTTKLLIADNVIYSRWRMMHFATRFVAHGIFGPFGGIATRIAFSYRKPRPYAHHSKRVPAWRIAAYLLASATTISVIVYFAERAGLLQAVGIVAAAFLFRLAALATNMIIWRQLSPIVGSGEKVRLLGWRRSKAQRGPGSHAAGEE